MKKEGVVEVDVKRVVNKMLDDNDHDFGAVAIWWSNNLVDALEKLYGLEAMVAAEFNRRGGNV